MLALFASVAAPAAPAGEPTNSVQRTIHEAENLSLNKDRLLACGVLWRNAKKASPADAKVLKDKLLQLSRYYYTDKGFQTFLEGKALLEKSRLADAADKFTEADDLEAGNVEILHYLTTAQLLLHRLAAAEATNKKALQACPIDIDLQRDSLDLQMSQEKWNDAAGTAENLIKEFNDGSAVTLQNWGAALIKLEMEDQAQKLLNQALAKDPKWPETYYWLGQLKNFPDSAKFLTKYIDLCKNKAKAEVGFCAHIREAESKAGS